ncbi:Uncharacterised protein [Nocardia africana]|uniref:DNA helicase n=1 Tax=Nocardia africana TaxID=134964 RepID=A0A378WPT2_9NOCA|nr:hypothetical protein [Nocardia africana]SUA42922.1 Uncharacterised protein [Nocardia africana]
MPDIHFERRRQRVAQQLGELTVLTPAWRRFLSVPLMRNGWHVLVERENSRSDRFDAYAVGPGGVFALVLTEVVPPAAELRRIRWRAEETFANVTAGRTRYVPHMIEVLLLMDEAPDTPAEARYVVVDLTTIAARLFAEASLSSRSARQIALTVAERNTWFALLSAESGPAPEIPPAEGLFETTTLREEERERALKRPFSEWMTFLDPAQLDLVYRNYNGPARFSGPAGTGKTVVALHRMARLSKEGAGRQLFTSFVRTLPTYHESGFRRLAPMRVSGWNSPDSTPGPLIFSAVAISVAARAAVTTPSITPGAMPAVTSNPSNRIRAIGRTNCIGSSRGKASTGTCI